MTGVPTIASLDDFNLFHIRGTAAREAVEAVLPDAPTAVLTVRDLADGGFIACLGKKEYFLLTHSGQPLLQPERRDDLTVYGRSDAMFLLSGDGVEEWLKRASPLDLRNRPPEEFLMSRLLKISCWLKKASGALGDGYLIGCDPTYSRYFTEALEASMQTCAAGK
jgi:hypothetical protein